MKSTPRFWIRSIPDKATIVMAPGWNIQPLIKDHPGVMGTMSLYFSTLAAGQRPHEAHVHDEDELIVLLSGELEVLEAGDVTRVGPGSFFHHPPGVSHTIRSAGPGPAHFLVAKWRDDSRDLVQRTPESFIHRGSPVPPPRREDRLSLSLIGKLPLGNGASLRIRLASCQAGDVVPVHVDPFDSLQVVLRGTFAGIWHDTPAPAVLYFARGTPHGFPRGIPDELSILCFEFHAG